MSSLERCPRTKESGEIKVAGRLLCVEHSEKGYRKEREVGKDILYLLKFCLPS